MFGASWAPVAAIYDIRSKGKVATFTAKETDIQQIDINDKFVSTASSDGILRIWDQRNFSSSMFEIAEHKRGIVSSYIDNYKSVSLAGDGRVRICNIAEQSETVNCTSFKFYGDQIAAMAVTKTSLFTLGETIRSTNFEAKKGHRKSLSGSFFQSIKNAIIRI